MIRSLWIAKTGLEAQQLNMDVISNNLANVNTNGFKRQRAVFQDLLYQNMRQPGALATEENTLPSGLQLGTGVRPVATQRVHTQGGMNPTGDEYDVAIEGEGFFQVQMPDGSTAYTRDGHFSKNADGQLVNAEGYPIQPGIVIPQDATKLNIGSDGIVSVKVPGQAEEQQIGQLTLTTFVNNSGLESIGGNLYKETQSSGAPNELNPGMESAGTLKQSYVEISNVNVAEELVTMIQVQRAYEINSKAVSASDQMLQRLSQL